ncbi:methylated-DNA--[protein]-cysteine S-methyltransferase [Metabacillus sp. KIGAM252]|uniref:Methylated-DNA--[protein]-cysteine S-methyltransferase n=1 Tax=Metabacillus flavus TaxID=2823519 RepID=A0ABS5LEM6_9BACI|nr:methylated-DNA--[protein]-cysteine S-methyltransferase [Metabacillus flavus]MBS2969200.1 methylated-DNA--[protein]-cysteine S-methyltransferase [Metabacillus flavus]
MTEIVPVYWSQFSHETFNPLPFYIAATDYGICRLTWPGESFEVLENWVALKIPGSKLEHNPKETAVYIQELMEYLNGERKVFQFPIDLYGTSFQKAIWNALLNIPYGAVRSYSQLAEAAGNKKAVRAAGTANGANPVPIAVPCHRVIGSNNTLTGFRGGLHMKEHLLRLEDYHDFSIKGHARFQF